jgi:hypothetical protein
LHLRIDKEMVKLTVRLHKRFRWCLRRGAKGGVRPAAGEQRRGVWLGENEGEAGDGFLTTRGSLDGRESGEGDDDGEDRRRQPEFKDGGGRFGWAD